MISREPRALKETQWGFTRLHWACFINTWIIKLHCQVHLRPNSLSASRLIHRFLPRSLWSLILRPFFIFKKLQSAIFIYVWTRLPQVWRKTKALSTLWTFHGWTNHTEALHVLATPLRNSFFCRNVKHTLFKCARLANGSRAVILRMYVEVNMEVPDVCCLVLFGWCVLELDWKMKKIILIMKIKIFLRLSFRTFLRSERCTGHQRQNEKITWREQ